ncbi:MAG: hypothetical protein HZA91_00625 [Verrucomicrobia bacterium]|nr:hypothetical protein [Verrucomicrobiota bacterium]
MSRNISRRLFLSTLAAAAADCGGAEKHAASGQTTSPAERERILNLINANRPSWLRRLPRDFRARVGAAHVAGKYHLTRKPFLIEGAEKLLELGARLGKFWFMPDGAQSSYPFNSQWGSYASLAELARSDYFQQLFALPFETIILEAQSPVEHRWQQAGLGDDFYEAVTREFYYLTAHFYRAYRDRPLTIVLQHWEGDWMLRGSGKSWNPPPADWRERCERMQHWLAARQAGVTKARAENGRSAKCRVAHAAEVNRVADLWRGIPTMTEHVLPGVELDLVSYSAYDSLADPMKLWDAIAEIRRHARTGPLFGKGAVYVGEIGIPENEQTENLTERWDQFMGVMLAARVHYVAHWELYCNEFAGKPSEPPKTPVTNPKLMRGFWLVKPDGSLSESGKYFAALWKRAG